MPKVKTKRSAKKRFKVTGAGHIKREKAFRSHILTSKAQKRKRRLRQATLVARVDEPRVRELLHS